RRHLRIVPRPPRQSRRKQGPGHTWLRIAAPSPGAPSAAKKVPFWRGAAVSLMTENRTARLGRPSMTDTPLARAGRGRRRIVGGSGAPDQSDGHLPALYAARQRTPEAIAVE